MASAYTGHQETFKRMARGERMQFGLEHAPEHVDPPDNRCERCENDTVLTVPSWFGRLCKGCEHEAAVEHWQSVLELSDDMPFREAQRIYIANEFCGITPKGITSHEAKLIATADACRQHPDIQRQLNNIGYDANCGMKPFDDWALEFMFAVLNDRVWCGMPEDPMDQDTRSILGLAITPFSDFVMSAPPNLMMDITEVMSKAGDISRKMEQQASAPSQLDQVTATAKKKMLKAFRTYVYHELEKMDCTSFHVPDQCDHMAIFRDYAESYLATDVGSIWRGTNPEEISKYRYSLVLTNRGSELLPPRSTSKPTETDAGREAAYVEMLNELSAADDAQARLDQVMEDMLLKFQMWLGFEILRDTKHLVSTNNFASVRKPFNDTQKHFRKLHKRSYPQASTKGKRIIPMVKDFDCLMAGWRYSLALANRGSELIAERDPWVQPEITREYSFALDWLARIHRWVAVKQSAAAAPILPQDLQSKEEALEAVAMSKLLIQPSTIDDLVEAVQVAIAEWNNNADARILPDGYYLYGKPEDMIVPIWIYLKHPSHPNRIVVGEMSIMSDTDTNSELKFVSSRGEIREYMYKVAAGMKPSDNPMLPGFMIQAPIPDHVKMTPQLRTLKNLTESTKAFMAVLNDEQDGTA